MSTRKQRHRAGLLMMNTMQNRWPRPVFFRRSQTPLLVPEIQFVTVPAYGSRTITMPWPYSRLEVKFPHGLKMSAAFVSGQPVLFGETFGAPIGWWQFDNGPGLIFQRQTPVLEITFSNPTAREISGYVQIAPRFRNKTTPVTSPTQQP